MMKYYYMLGIFLISHITYPMSNQPITIRKAQESDIPALQQLLAKVVRETYKDNYTPDTLKKMIEYSYATERLKQDIEDPNVLFLVATTPDKLIGTATKTFKNSAYWIKRFYLDSQFQRKGLGTQLLNILTHDLKGYPIRAEVEKRNKVCIKFFQKNHFIIEDEKQDIFNNEKVPIVIFRKEPAMNNVLDELQKLVKNFITERDWQQFHDPKNMSMHIATEAAELMDIFRWVDNKNSFEHYQQHKEEVEHEIADIFFGLLNFCERTNIDLIEALKKKMEINAKKYPIEKAKGKINKYNEL